MVINSCGTFLSCCSKHLMPLHKSLVNMSLVGSWKSFSRYSSQIESFIVFCETLCAIEQKNSIKLKVNWQQSY